MDTIDLYSDLDNFDNNVEKIQQENAKLVILRDNLESDLKNLTNQVAEMRQIQDKLTVNISELYRTTKSEVSRKDRMIEELQQKIKRFEYRIHHRRDDERFKRNTSDRHSSSSNYKRSRPDSEAGEDRNCSSGNYKRTRPDSEPVEERNDSRKRRRSRSPDYYKYKYKDERHNRDDYKNRRPADDRSKSTRDSKHYKQKSDTVSNSEHKKDKSKSNSNDYMWKLGLESKKESMTNKNVEQTTSNVKGNDSKTCTETKKQTVIILQNEIIQEATDNHICNGTSNNSNNVNKIVKFPTNLLNTLNDAKPKNLLDNDSTDKSVIRPRGRPRGRRKSDIYKALNTDNIIKDGDLSTTPEDEVRVLRSMIKKSSCKSETSSKNDDEIRTEAENECNKEIQQNPSSKELKSLNKSSILNDKKDTVKCSRKLNAESDLRAPEKLAKNTTENGKECEISSPKLCLKVVQSPSKSSNNLDLSPVLNDESNTPNPDSEFSKKSCSSKTESPFKNGDEIVTKSDKELTHYSSEIVTPSKDVSKSPRSEGELTPSPKSTQKPTSNTNKHRFIITNVSNDSFPVLHIPDNGTDCDNDKTLDNIALGSNTSESNLNQLRNDLCMSDGSDNEPLSAKCVNKDVVDKTNVVNDVQVVNRTSNSINNRRRRRCYMTFKNS